MGLIKREGGGETHTHTHTPVISVFHAALGLCVWFDWGFLPTRTPVRNDGRTLTLVDGAAAGGEDAGDGERDEGADVVVPCA